MPTFRPYTDSELRDAAAAYDLDPAFVEAVYAVESSRGTNPKAMSARSVKRKRDSTIVRGPFQLEDDTTSDLIRRHQMGKVDVDDPDVHLDLALRLMKDLKDKYNGDYRKVAQEYLGGPGGVADITRKDELGTSTGAYGNKIMAEMDSIKGRAPAADVAADSPRTPLDIPSGDGLPPYFAADAGDDMFGIPDSVASLPPMASSDHVSWRDLMAANRSGPSPLGLTPEMGGNIPDLMPATSDDVAEYVRRLTNEEFEDKDFSNA